MKKLNEAKEYSFRKLSPFRQKRVEFIKQFCGKHYGNEGAEGDVYVNLMELAISIYTRSLISAAPRALITTRKAELKPVAAKLELAMDHLIEKIRLKRTLDMWIKEAIVSPFGIVKCGLERNGTVDLRGSSFAVGQPFAEVVQIDNWVHDMNAWTLQESSFSGNKYRVTWEEFKESGLYKTSDGDRPSEPDMYDSDGDPKAESISKGSDSDAPSYRDYIELWDYWIPSQRLIITVKNDTPEVPVRIVDWDGPETGPYHDLSFTEVPGQVLPLPPAAVWYGLHMLVNNLYRKLARQAKRQKTITAVPTGMEKDGENELDADDGQMIRYDGAGKIQEVVRGGIDQRNFAFAMSGRDIYSWLAGNLDVLGGLSPQAETATQERLLAKNSSVRINEMQDRVVNATRLLMRDLSWFMYTDPLIELPLTKRIPGVSVDIPVTLKASDLTADFIEYNFDIDPYSLQGQTPASKLALLSETMQEAMMLQQQLAIAGKTIDVDAYFRLKARYTNASDLEDLIVPSGIGMDEYQKVIGGDGVRQSPNTTRTNVRVNRPGGTRQGSDQVLVNSLMGGNPQKDQMAQVGRPNA